MNQNKFLTLTLACVLQMSFFSTTIASDKYGGGSSTSSGDSNYSVSSTRSTVTVTDNRTGDYNTLSDWNGDGRYDGPNENVSGNNRSGDGGSGNGSSNSCYYRTCPSLYPAYCPTAASARVAGGQSTCSGSCGAARPPDTACINLPLDPVTALVLNPSIVRVGNDTTITWNLGQNYPTNCTLTGQGLETFTFGPADRTGATSTVVTGPHRYTLQCGGVPVVRDLRVLPVLYES